MKIVEMAVKTQQLIATTPRSLNAQQASSQWEMIARLPFAARSVAGSRIAGGTVHWPRAAPARPPIIKAQSWDTVSGTVAGATLAQPLVPKMIRVIPITPRVKPQPATTTQRQWRRVVKQAPPVTAKPKRDTSDVCKGKGHRFRNGGRSWRCKR